jgi:molybdopterin converting factor small subunit
MAHYTYRISVNNELTNEDRTLSDGDEIALLPPFAGG